MIDILTKQSEIIESLVWLNKKILNLLSQFVSVEEYENQLDKIVQGDDVLI